MPVSAIDTPTQVIVSPTGAQGQAGTNGTDGVGFNSVRKSLIDNPLSWLYRKNNLVSILKNTLVIDRSTTGAYTDIYGNAQVAPIDAPREEVEGWLVTVDDTSYTYQIQDNIPLLNDGFSAVLTVGAYAEAAVSQDIFVVAGTNGDLFTVGSDASGNWVTTMLGSDSIEYEATTIVSATSASLQTVIVTFLAGVLNIYIDGTLAGTITLATGLTDSIDLTGVVTTAGNFTLNLQGLRFYDFILNTDEITYLS
jgi:hypothetical protein